MDRLKSASLHDLRRSFGERWQKRVTPQILMELALHDSMTTPMTFCATRHAKETTEDLADSACQANEWHLW